MLSVSVVSENWFIFSLQILKYEPILRLFRPPSRSHSSFVRIIGWGLLISVTRSFDIFVQNLVTLLKGWCPISCVWATAGQTEGKILHHWQTWALKVMAKYAWLNFNDSFQIRCFPIFANELCLLRPLGFIDSNGDLDLENMENAPFPLGNGLVYRHVTYQ